MARLFELHEKEAGTKAGRKRGVEVLNKSAVVLTCAAWEAYCEDIIGEAVGHLADDCIDPQSLPEKIRRRIATTLKGDPHDLAVWRLAGDGWKGVLKTNADNVTKKFTGAWHSPTSQNVVDLFSDALGIADVSSGWTWGQMKPDKAREKLDAFVNVRGEIAHRLQAAKPVHKSAGRSFFTHVTQLSRRIDDAVSSMLFGSTGKQYW